ncbi:hypothetical protein ACO0LD_17965 [Undibacterium sp. Ji83W]|uniref:hypothetical protein n=1 Tax=Undibacterium sp. Ji83W TaxID=3413043 RepID=UPI003BF193E0
MRRLIILFSILVLNAVNTSAFADTSLKIVTNAGVVGFTVDDGWAVLNMQSKLPVATAVFQIPNVADKQTSDSTNLILKFYDLNTEAGRAAYDAPVKQFGSSAPKEEIFGPWTLFRQEALQGTTRYTILDARRGSLADVSATARIAWPHLKNNAKKYDAQIEGRFRSFLNSVHGELGLYKPQQNEVMRRPVE